jgi:ABC-type Fe3+-hydroxamate transport system substrate-binding protein
VPAGSPGAGYFSYGPGTFGTSLLELVGGASISAGATLSYPTLSGAQVLAANPAVIVCATGPLGETLAQYAQGPDWSQLAAVQLHRFFGLDATLLTEADPTMILSGVPALLAILHPGSA